MIDRQRPLDLFRCHVAVCAEDLVRRGQGDVDRCPAEKLCQPEVCDLRGRDRPADVLRLDIAVDHTLVVSVLECVANLANDLERVGWAERPIAKRLSQVDAVHVSITR
jgi:hypothetical protein